MTMEIKQGDKVRVSKDAPKMYFHDKIGEYTERDCTVVAVEKDNAVISVDLDFITMPCESVVIPCKYLVKVGAEVGIGDRVIVHYPSGDRIGRIQEEMSDGTYDIDYGDGCTGHNITRSQIEPYTAPKFKVGDRVKFKNIYELQKVKDKSFRWMLVMFASKEATITAVEDNGFYRVDIDPSIGGINDDMIERKVEPTEQTEAKETFEDQIRDVLNGVEHQDFWRPIQTAMINLDINDWDAYTADLAKEIVLKTVNSASDRRPSVIAEYATDVAKAVVEGLKRK